MEGPSLVIFTEDMAPFIGSKVLQSEGTLPLAAGRTRPTLKAVKTWGKHALLIFDDSTLRIHFLMFGNYRIDEETPDREPKLQLHFKKSPVRCVR